MGETDESGGDASLEANDKRNEEMKAKAKVLQEQLSFVSTVDSAWVVRCRAVYFGPAPPGDEAQSAPTPTSGAGAGAGAGAPVSAALVVGVATEWFEDSFSVGSFLEEHCLTYADRVHVALQVAYAVAATQSAGLVHSSINAQHVLVRQRRNHLEDRSNAEVEVKLSAYESISKRSEAAPGR